MTNVPTRPDPVVTSDTRFFWEGVERGKLLAQQCQECKAFRHPPRAMCPGCNSLQWDAVPLSGKGEVYSWLLPRHPLVPDFESPLIVALIDLEEGIRLLSNVIGISPDDLDNGQAVEVCYAPTKGGKAVPVFKPVARGAQS
jgi:uncharacterized OB-fold protein